jgi:hypothetical protein
MNDLQIGRHISHQEHGEGVITSVGDEYVQVQFDDNRDVLLRKDALSGNGMLDSSQIDTGGAATPASWPENTFIQEPAETTHYMLSHWDPFIDEPQVLLKRRLPEIVKHYTRLRGFGSFYPAPHELPASWAPGDHYAWPDNHHGLAVTIKGEAPLKSLVSIYPYSEAGIQTTIILRSVRVWESGVEAQITAALEEGSVTFFDTHFLNNRGWYESNKAYDFILLGIAYDAKPSTLMEIPYNPTPDVVTWLEKYAKDHDLPPPHFTGSLSMKGMAAFLDVPEWDKDDYSFRGPVKSVKAAPEILGQPGWIARVTVMRFGEQDADLDILITRRAWQGSEPPQLGQDIEGTLWLQGRLWYSQEWEMRSSR